MIIRDTIYNIIYRCNRVCTKLCVLCLLCVLCASKVHAQNITTLDWDVMRIDSVLPVYTEVVPLESDYRLFDYKVSVEYPEWVPLTAAETRKLEKMDISGIGEDIDVSSSVSIFRKRGMLDIAFVPIIKRDGKYLKLQSASITITPKAKTDGKGLRVKGEGLRVKDVIGQPEGVTLAVQERLRVKSESERYARKSVLAEGRWVRISITQDGMYRLTRSSLQRMGFSNPDNVHLYGYGGHRLSEVSDPDNEFDDLQEVPLYKADANTWLFWGNGLLYWNGDTRIFNPYANQASYFLTETGTSNGIQTITATASPTNTYDSFTDHVLYEKDEYAWFHGGRNLFENVNYATSNSHTYHLSTPNSTGKERLTVVFTAGEDTETKVTTNVNGTNIGTSSVAKLSDYIYGTSSTKTTDVSAYRNNNEWSIKLTSTANHNARLDYLAIHYQRGLVPNDGYIAFSGTSESPAQFNVSGTDLQVMRIGEPGDPACIMQGRQEGNVYCVNVDDGSRRYVAFQPGYAFPEPTVIGDVANQNLHGMGQTDMVIIVPTSGKLWAQAERLAQAHRDYDGLRVAVFSAQMIYNEFSSGTPDATAYRRLMKMLYDRAETDDDAPRYLLLFGDCAWDNRMISTSWKNTSPDDYLLCFESENSFSDTQCYVMEDYFGLLDDGEGSKLTDDKTDLGVGRFPVTSASEAEKLVNKTIDFLSNAYAGNWKNIVCVMGDDGDNNSHMEYANDVAEQVVSTNPEMEVRKVMWDAYTRVSSIRSNTYPEVTQILKKQMEDGALVMNYVGHAATYCLSHEFVLKLEDFANTQSKKLPLWITAACDVMPFDGKGDNIGETAILNGNGAAVAFYGTARTVYAGNNDYMNRWFMRYLLGTDEQGRRYRVGDAIRLAKNNLISKKLETVHKENKLHYALLGDPALTFGAPINRVVLDAINGVAVKGASDIQLQAGEKVTLTGHIENAQGETLSAYKGVLTARVYDNLEEITCHNNAGAKNGPFVFTNREKVLFNGQDSIVDGKFSITYVMPIDINFSNESGRAVFYAINNEHTVEANGYCENFTVGGISPSISGDGEGPHIYAYLNTEDFQNGGYVNTTPYFVAKLQDDSGISYSGIGLGHDLVLTIDGDASQTYVLNDYYTGEFGDYTQGTVAFSIPELSKGAHTLTFRAWDSLNNTSATSLDFVVDDRLKPTLFHVAVSQNPALTSTNFLISYNLPGSDCDFLIEVFDFAGRNMWSHRATTSTETGLYSVPWNLTTGSGGRLGAGIYLYRVTVKCGNSKKVSKSQKLIIHGNK